MFDFIPTDASPFLVLWYIFIAFFVVVVTFQIIMVLVRVVLAWRVRSLTKHYLKEN